jgi:hypothetical protein
MNYRAVLIICISVMVLIAFALLGSAAGLPQWAFFLGGGLIGAVAMRYVLD